MPVTLCIWTCMLSKQWIYNYKQTHESIYLYVCILNCIHIVYVSMQAFAVNTRYDARRPVTMKLLANVTRLFLLYERSRVFSLLAVVGSHLLFWNSLMINTSEQIKYSVKYSAGDLLLNVMTFWAVSKLFEG